MDCARVASVLVSYHFGTSSEEEHDAIDAHLVDCQSCLKAYLALKRAADARPLDRPSDAARARLRADVARTFVPKIAATKPPVAIFSRRIPLYQGVVAAAIAAAIALAVPRLVARASHSEIGEGAPEVDTSRARAESLNIY